MLDDRSFAYWDPGEPDADAVAERLGDMLGAQLRAERRAPGWQVDPGTYTARFTRWHWDTSKKGDMCLAAMLRIVGGPFDGQQVRGTLYFDTDKADKLKEKP